MKLYSIDDLAVKYNRTQRTVQAWLERFKIAPVEKGDRGKNLYHANQIRVLDDYSQHLKDGGTKTSFSVLAPAELVEEEEVDLALPYHVANIHSTDYFRQIYSEFANSDPFYDYETLQRAADKCWHLPTDKLAVIIGKSPRTIRRLKSFVYQGFIIVKTSKAGGMYLWSVNANQ